MKITNIVDKTNSTLSCSPEMTLRDALADIGKHRALKKGKKILIVALDDTDSIDDDVNITWYQAGMKEMELISLLEVAKSLFIKEAGF
jgi:hypothetical protein